MENRAWVHRRRGTLLVVACLLAAVAVALATTSSDSIDGLVLEQNFPNPFSDRTEIRYTLPEAGHVTMRVTNTLGLEIQLLVNETQTPGNYITRFDGTSFPTGQYTYFLEFTRTDDGAKEKLSKRMYLVR